MGIDRIVEQVKQVFFSSYISRDFLKLARLHLFLPLDSLYNLSAIFPSHKELA